MDNKNDNDSNNQGFSRWMDALGITESVGMVQKSVFSGTARMLRKVFDMSSENILLALGYMLQPTHEEYVGSKNGLCLSYLIR